MRVEEKEMRVFAHDCSRTLFMLSLSLFFRYPERDLNPHNRNGHRILSPACLPFHHPGGIISFIGYFLKKHSPACRTLSAVAGIPPSGRNYIFIQYSQKTCPACRTLSRHSGNSTIRAGLYLYSILPKNMSCVSDPVPPEREIPPSGRNYIFIQYSQKTCPACRTLSRQSGNSTIRAELIFIQYSQ